MGLWLRAAAGVTLFRGILNYIGLRNNFINLA